MYDRPYPFVAQDCVVYSARSKGEIRYSSFMVAEPGCPKGFLGSDSTRSVSGDTPVLHVCSRTVEVP